ncbi:cation channel sperm-associated auxiliary subunit TMEM249 [Chelonoidis abingdonii]|uniref:cation channel sperm-associated auxiliary subunit TMEM249 n=1 Tax=Chelonoidis abingdonii TaxID=106734 RepID=UPI003F494E87
MLRGAFMLWNLCFFDVERSLARRLQQNTHYPFQVQQPNVFVMEYYKDTLWKGALVFLICVLGGVFYFKSEKVGEPVAGPRLCPRAPQLGPSHSLPGPQGLVLGQAKGVVPIPTIGLLPQPGSQDQQVSLAPAPSPPCSSLALGLGSRVRPLQVSQDYFGFFVYGTLVGFWLLLSSMHKRHLVINHVQGCYQIYIKRRLWEEGPLHQIYVRLTAQTDGTAPARGESPPCPHGTLVPHWLPLACPAAYGKCFYSLIINGHGLEVLALASLSDKYEHMEFLGRRIARRLKLNYFDYLDVSTRHVIRHRPPLERDEELQV